MWIEELKKAGVNIHVIATGAGAGLQQLLWQTPGSSAYLSGASFPYDQAETEELLGFTPDHFVSQETAIDLASAAYMKAFKFGGKKPVGIGITASVASETAHRGDHRFNVCVITNDKVITDYVILDKGVGFEQRCKDGKIVDNTAFMLMFEALGIGDGSWKGLDAYDLAKARFFQRPFFTANGKRLAKVPQEAIYAMMPGSFNPPHEGHFGLARNFRHQQGKNVLFEIGTNPPHKAPPTVQELLQRAKMLKGYDILFSRDMPMYLQKAAQFHGMPFIVGADTMLRILDPKWGMDPIPMLEEIGAYGNDFFVSGREIDGKFVTRDDIVASLPENKRVALGGMILPLDGRWDISSTELRNKVK